MRRPIVKRFIIESQVRGRWVATVHFQSFYVFEIFQSKILEENLSISFQLLSSYSFHSNKAFITTSLVEVTNDLHIAKWNCHSAIFSTCWQHLTPYFFPTHFFPTLLLGYPALGFPPRSLASPFNLFTFCSHLPSEATGLRLLFYSFPC